MKSKSFFVNHFPVFYGLICLGANVLAVFSSNLTTFPLPEMNSLALWQSFVDQHRIVIDGLSVFCYVLPIILCITYSFKGYHLQKDDPKLIKIRVHMPAAFALRGITGWISNFLLLFFSLLYFQITKKIDIIFLLIANISSYTFLSIFAFTIIYFTLETLNRNVVLPTIYPDGGISETERMSLSSIRNLFLFYFFSAAFFPTAYMGIRLFLTKRYNIEIKDYSDFLYVGLLLLIGFVLTLLISGYFQKPLKKLKQSAEEISKGNLDSKTVICSNDEMGILGDAFNAMTSSLKEKEFMRDTFGKIVTPEIRDYLLKENVELGGESREITVMFCDIRGFTTLSENMKPEKIVQLLNEYFTGLEKCIHAHGGVINKYIGDAIMALFGAPIQSDSHATDAFLAALDMRSELKKMNEQFAKKGLPQIRFGIGIHSGIVLAGNIGAKNRMEYTVIGDTVNTASRIEGLCKLYKKDLLLSEVTVEKISSDKNNNKNAPFEFVADAEIRGRTEKMKVFTCFV